MANFLVGVAASLVATVVFLVLSFVWSKKFRWWLSCQLARLSAGDFGQTWANKTEATNDIAQELSRARFVWLLSGRGNELQRGVFERVLERASKDRCQFRIMLPSTDPDDRGRWTRAREAELASFDPSFGAGLLVQQIELTISSLEPYVLSRRIELRRFDSPHLGRVLVTDHAAYLTPYSTHRHGRDDPVLKYPPASPMYDFLIRYFEMQWNRS